MNITEPSEPQPGSEWIVGGGDMGHLIRAMDWSHTPLGPIASWPQSLRTTVNLCLASELPICIIWGPELVQLYNDAYRVICGEKHPRSMGQNFQECFSEAWPVIGAAHDSALAGDTAFLENQHIFLDRHGYTEECFFTFSFSPIRDETGRLAGLFHPVIETTAKMLGERRTRTLRDLASGVMNAKSVEEAFALSTQALAEDALDLPFLLIYRLEEAEQLARLVAATGLAPGSNGAPEILRLHVPDHATWPLDEAFGAGKAMLLNDVAARFGSFSVGPYPESIASVMLLPIMTPGAERPMAVVIAGVSPRLKTNEMYLGFHDLLSGAIRTAVANADAYEAERSRAEAYAKIDRAKTEFFSNVSHEFRTPLTLMLGPLEDALAGVNLPAHERALIDVAHRNSQRLLKLVNSLLDFSRIEAGRAQAAYEAVDLAALTAMFASNFRSACERAELKLVVDCPPLPEPVYVDRDMWEKIVLNLVSNAFKFTFEGEIAIRLRSDGDKAELTVRDTGVGIPFAELPRMFERFHRVENQKGRSFEGSGIGLALVQELVTLHGGSIRVDSEVGRWTEFSILIPFGTEHLPHDHILGEAAVASTAVRAHAYVEEALRWLPAAISAEALTEKAHVESSANLSALSSAGRSRVLLADDNADMRDYVRQLLGAHHEVEAVPDGEAALEAARERRPDLMITDVMMPKLDGLGLVRAIRSDAKLSDLPIIMLSARAGEEASIEGLSAGADDYLVKPFSARELIARVNAALVMARLRRENAESLRQSAAEFEALAENVSQLAWMAEPDGSIFWYNRRWYEYTGTDLESMKDWGWREVHHPDHIERVIEEVRGNWAAGEPWEGTYRIRSAQGEYGWFLTRAEPIRNEAGELIRWFGTNTDVTAQRQSEARQRLALSLSDRLKEMSDPREIAAAAVELLGRHLGVSRAGFGEMEADDTTITFETDYADGVEHLVGSFPVTNFGRGNFVDLRRGLTTTYADLTADPRTNGSDWAAIETKSAMAAPLIREGRLRAVLYLNHRDIREWTPDEVTLVEDVAARVWDALERARAETELRDVNATLEARVTERTAELEQAQEALRQSQKLEAMGQLTGGVAHDFNNLLTPIVGSLDMLQRRGIGGEREQRLIAGAVQSAERAKVLVQRLLAFARRQPLQATAVDVAKLVNGMADLIGSTSGPQIKVVVVAPADLPSAMADPNQLEMALLNLAVNARDAMPEGGTLRLSASEEQVGSGHPSKLRVGRYVRLSVADTGAGMDDATLARAVEPFFSTKGVGKGTGLGLSMAHGLALQLGGALQIQSRPGIGTNVEFWLPISQAPAETTDAVAEAAPTAAAAGTALLVDDEELVRMSTADMLSDLGYVVVEAASAEEALRLIRDGLRPDLLVSDHLMPGMNGTDLARIVRSERPSVQILIVSGYAESEGIAPDLPRLAKPFRNDELAASLAALPSSAVH